MKTSSWVSLVRALALMKERGRRSLLLFASLLLMVSSLMIGTEVWASEVAVVVSDTNTAAGAAPVFTNSKVIFAGITGAAAPLPLNTPPNTSPAMCVDFGYVTPGGNSVKTFAVGFDVGGVATAPATTLNLDVPNFVPNPDNTFAFLPTQNPPVVNQTGILPGAGLGEVVVAGPAPALLAVPTASPFAPADIAPGNPAYFSVIFQPTNPVTVATPVMGRVLQIGNDNAGTGAGTPAINKPDSGSSCSHCGSKSPTQTDSGRFY